MVCARSAMVERASCEVAMPSYSHLPTYVAFLLTTDYHTHRVPTPTDSLLTTY